MKSTERRERTMAHIRNEILEAAITAFGRGGINNTTMQDIAKEAGFTAASLYTYFKSKQELVEATIGYLTDEYCRVFDEPIPATLSFRQRFDLVLRRQLDLIDRRHAAFAGFLNEHTNQSFCAADPKGHAFHVNFERRIQRLSEWLKVNATPEDIGGHDPDLLARLCFGMAFALLHRWGAEQKVVTPNEFIPIFTDFFFFGISGKSKTGARKR